MNKSWKGKDQWPNKGKDRETVWNKAQQNFKQPNGDRKPRAVMKGDRLYQQKIASKAWNVKNREKERVREEGDRGVCVCQRDLGEKRETSI